MRNPVNLCILAIVAVTSMSCAKSHLKGITILYLFTIISFQIGKLTYLVFRKRKNAEVSPVETFLRHHQRCQASKTMQTHHKITIKVVKMSYVVG